MTKDEKNYLCQEIDKVSQDKAIDLLKKNFIVSNIKHTDPTSRHDLELTINNKYDYKIEVKRYLNLYQSYRYSMVEVSKTDYLKQLDGNVVASRNQHIMPMEEEDEALGRTMEMPRTGSFMNDITAVQSYSTTPKLSRASQIVEEEAQPEVYDEFVNEEPVDLMSNYFEDAGEKKIVLSSNDISSDDMEETDHLDLFDPAKYESYEEEVEEDDDDDEEEVVSKRKLKKQQKKAAKKAKKEQKKAAKKARREEVEEEVEMPSSKMRMQAEDFDDEDDEPKSGIILNVILILLIIALVVSIGFTIYFLYNMGK